MHLGCRPRDALAHATESTRTAPAAVHGVGEVDGGGPGGVDRVDEGLSVLAVDGTRRRAASRNENEEYCEEAYTE